MKYLPYLFIFFICSCNHNPVTQATIIQECQGGSTPVVSSDLKPMGCNPAKNNQVEEGAKCDPSQAGGVTTDINGNTYKCIDSKDLKNKKIEIRSEK